MPRATIRNKNTGQVITVDASQLSSYGLSAPTTKTSTLDKAREPGFFEKAFGFIAPRIAETTRAVGAGLGLGGIDELSESTQQARDMSRKLIEQAKQTTDPAEKKRLLDESRRIDQEAGERFRGFTGDVEKQAGIDIGEQAGISGTRRALGVAGEVATLMLPGGITKRGIGVAAKTGAKLGAASAGLTALTDPKVSLDNPEEMERYFNSLWQAPLFGGVFGGTIGAGSEMIGQIWRGLSKTLPKKMVRNIFGAEKAGEEFSEEYLKRNTPNNLKQMGKWASEVFDESEKQLAKISEEAGEKITLQDIQLNTFAKGNPRGQKFILDNMIETASSLESRGQQEASERLFNIANNLESKSGISLDDVLFVKRRFDDIAKPALQSGAKIVGIDNEKVASAVLISNEFRNIARKHPGIKDIAIKVGDETLTASKILDTEKFAFQLKSLAEWGEAQATKRSLPKWWQISAGVAGAVGLAIGNPMFSIPAFIALGGEKVLSSPRVAKGLYKAGEKVVPRVAGKVQDPVTEFLIKTGGLNIGQ